MRFHKSNAEGHTAAQGHAYYCPRQSLKSLKTLRHMKGRLNVRPARRIWTSESTSKATLTQCWSAYASTAQLHTSRAFDVSSACLVAFIARISHHHFRTCSRSRWRKVCGPVRRASRASAFSDIFETSLEGRERYSTHMYYRILLRYVRRQESFVCVV